MENLVLTLEQAAQYLQLSPEELQVELEKGTVPGRKFLGKWRVHREALDRLLGVGSNDEAIIPLGDEALQNSDNPPQQVSPVFCAACARQKTHARAVTTHRFAK